MSQDSENSFPGKPLGDGLYEVKLSDLDDLVIFRPGIPDYDSPDAVLAPSEPVTESTELLPVDVVIFYDRFSLNPMSEGCNQWAFVVDERRALFHRWLVHSVKLSTLRTKRGSIRIERIPRDLAPDVAAFLLKFRWRPALFRAAINHLQFNNYLPFIEKSFYPPDILYADDDDYERRWQHMIRHLQPHDIIFTFDRTSWLSRLIAKVTHGPFSHVAHYIGDGNIWEIVTSGARVVPLSTYKDRSKYRVAVYRHGGLEAMPREQQLSEMQDMVGNVRYSYFGAIGAGIKTYFGWHRGSGSPNGIILSGPLVFIAQA